MYYDDQSYLCDYPYCTGAETEILRSVTSQDHGYEPRGSECRLMPLTRTHRPEARSGKMTHSKEKGPKVSGSQFLSVGDPTDGWNLRVLESFPCLHFHHLTNLSLFL